MCPTPGSTSSCAPSDVGERRAVVPACCGRARPRSRATARRTAAHSSGRSRSSSAGSAAETTGAARAAPRSRLAAHSRSRPSRRAMPTNQPKTTRRGRAYVAAAPPHSGSVAASARWNGSTKRARRSSQRSHADRRARHHARHRPLRGPGDGERRAEGVADHRRPLDLELVDGMRHQAHRGIERERLERVGAAVAGQVDRPPRGACGRAARRTAAGSRASRSARAGAPPAGPPPTPPG